MGRTIRYLDYLFVLRPTLFFAVWTVFLCGLWAAKTFGQAKEPVAPGQVWQLALAISLTMGSVFVVNQLQDVETDLANDKLYLIARKEIPARHAQIEALLLLILGLLLAAGVSLLACALCFLLFAVGGFAYSFEPLAWKNHPLLGMAVNGLGALLIFASGWLAGGELQPRLLRFALPYVLAVLAVYLLTTIPDEPGDRQSGKVTFVIRYGLRATTLWAAMAVGASLLVGSVNRDPVIALPALGALPLFGLAAKRLGLGDIFRAIKFGILFQALAVCVVFPLFLVLLAIVFFGSKLYYRGRFGVDYPSFDS
ncbi:MAG: UbiA family prenyltransferase [candidate division KSB1 bacterium]|nr:UbiA family prenyltransferase [candidate division KSB1 bacterium]